MMIAGNASDAVFQHVVVVIHPTGRSASRDFVRLCSKPQATLDVASGHSPATVKRAAHGYEPTREAAMTAFGSRAGENERPACLQQTGLPSMDIEIRTRPADIR
jgi:hypothetical protein